MNCWEYKKCAEEVFKTCPAYPDSGARCWVLAGVKCQGGEKEFSSLDEQIACCGKCDFYSRGSAESPEVSLISQPPEFLREFAPSKVFRSKSALSVRRRR